ncbi:MAG: PhzF family phenazine biosynthesis protein [Acidobacteriota bacterium]|jgi:predicted PhzF superfamily epimerase YddE/YHI9
MGVALFQVDAFTARPFGGNPAAVCLPPGEPDADWMQRVAVEMNLSETAFAWPEGEGFRLRWFTPTTEVPLCGHATLATAHVLLESGAAPGDLTFRTRSGPLGARREGRLVAIDLPAQTLEPVALPESIRRALPAVRHVARTPDRGLDDFDYLLELEGEEAVRRLAPPLEAMRQERGGFIVTARPDDEAGGTDYVCRYFAPHYGIDEDPVTGAAHCALAPFWSRRLGRAGLVGMQLSHRPGRVRAEVLGDRVVLGGEAVTVLRGELLV